MKKTIVVGLAVLLLPLFSLACQHVGRSARPSNGGPTAEQQVAALHDAWCRAHQEYDAAWFERHIADTMVNTMGRTVTGKRQLLERVTRRENRFDSLTYDELNVQAYGDTAIATGIVFARGTSSEGRAFQGRARFTNVWIKRGSVWQCVAQHETGLGEK
jgi:ketosteroid isomerase-like protein